MRDVVRALSVLVFVGLILAGCAAVPPPPKPASGPGTRSIVLVRSDTNEKVATTFWRNGAYDERALLEIAFLFRDRRSGEVNPVAPALIDFIADLRDRIGIPETGAIVVLSGYRSPQSNAQLARSNGNVAENSYHIRGMAADIRIPGIPGRMLRDHALAMRRGGVAYYPGTDHVHLDIGPVRTWAGK